MTTVTIEPAGTLALEQLDAAHWANPRGDVDTTSPAFAELQASIAAQGILEPIVIGPALAELDGRHPIIAGWRRYTAALATGLTAVPVHHRPDIADRRTALRAALAENMAREDMTPMAEAAAIATLVELGDTQVEAARAVGVSERTARERLRLLDLPKAVRDAIDAGTVPTTCTRQLQVIADASPAAAAAITKQIIRGTVRAVDLLDPAGYAETLRKLDPKQSQLVALSNYVSLKRLGLSGDVVEVLQARNKKASPYSNDGEHMEMSLRLIGMPLLDEARAAGKVLTVPAAAGYGEKTYLSGPDWIERAATAAVEALERVAEKRASQQTQPAAPLPEMPGERRRRERLDEAEALNERAKPHAAHMNADIGRRLRELTSCPIDELVARILIELTLAVEGLGADHACRGYRLVDPDSTWAKMAPHIDGTWEAWEQTLRGAKTPEHAAAHIVKALTASLLADDRTEPAVSSLVDHTDELRQLVRDAAVQLALVPGRAIALADATAQLRAQRDRHSRQSARRRVLFELTNAKGPLEQLELRKRASAWGREPGDLLDIGMSVNTQVFALALQDLIEVKHVKTTDRTDDKNAIVHTRVAITTAGREALTDEPDLPPIIADIDAGATLPDDEPDEPQDDDDVGNGVTRCSQVLALIGAHPGITIPELAERMVIKQNYLYRLLPGLADDGKVRKEGRGWYPQLLAVPAQEVEAATGVVIVHVTPTAGGDPVQAELQPDAAKRGQRKVIYTASRTSAWVAESRVTDLPVEAVT